MAKVHPGATLTPHFRDFLPTWVARQSWYPGSGIPSLAPVGYFRFEDPAGQVGIETHLVADGSVLYQVPMTYRGTPLGDRVPGTAQPLIATAEHSVLGTRWIYDAVADPVRVGEVLRLVRTAAISEPSSKRGVGPAEARGRTLIAGELSGQGVSVELKRVVTGQRPVLGPGVLGLVTGSWHPDGPGTAVATGCLAVVRDMATTTSQAR